MILSIKHDTQYSHLKGLWNLKIWLTVLAGQNVLRLYIQFVARSVMFIIDTFPHLSMPPHFYWSTTSTLAKEWQFLPQLLRLIIQTKHLNKKIIRLQWALPEFQFTNPILPYFKSRSIDRMVCRTPPERQTVSVAELFILISLSACYYCLLRETTIVALEARSRCWRGMIDGQTLRTAGYICLTGSDHLHPTLQLSF